MILLCRGKRSVTGRRSGSSSGGVEWLPVPGEEFSEAASRVVGEAEEQVSEIVLRVEAVELGALDQRIERSGAAAAGIGAGKQIILAANGDTAQGALGGSFFRRQRGGT